MTEEEEKTEISGSVLPLHHARNPQDEASESLKRGEAARRFYCNLCNREFKSKSGLISHMGAKTRCDEKHDLNWLTINLNQQSIQTALNENILLVASFEKLARTVKDAQSVDNCRRELLKVKSKTKKLIAHLRLISLQSGNINQYNKEIDQLQNQIGELTIKYKLLLF